MNLGASISVLQNDFIPKMIINRTGALNLSELLYHTCFITVSVLWLALDSLRAVPNSTNIWC